MDRIYIAEDNQTSRYFLKKVLTGAGYEVETFKNGKELLDALNSCKPDLIVTDIHMPVMDGFEVVDKIRELDAYSHLPIIITSATYKDVSSKIKGFELGANDYITPPIYEDELVAKVKSMIRTKNIYEKLQASEKKYRELFESIQDICYQADKQDNISMINPAGARILGYDSPEEIIGKNMADNFCFHPEERKKNLKKIEEGKGFIRGMEVTLKKKSGTPIIVTATCHYLYDGQGKIAGVEGILVDVTKQKKMEKELKKLAYFDILTGAYSRGYGSGLLKRQIKTAQRNKNSILLSYIDLDGLKYINDNFGHEEGDKTLKEVAKFLNSILREVDIVCRMGGDEFLIIFPDSSIKDVSLIKKRIFSKLRKLNKELNKPYKIDFSIGFSCYNPSEPLAVEELIRIADEDMYREKKIKKV